MNTPANPYHLTPDPQAAAAFAGRQEAFARQHQYLTEASSTGAMVFTGWKNVGKTAFLRQFDQVYDDSLVGVYVPLAERDVSTNARFLRVLIDETVKTLTARDFSLNRVPDTPEQVDDWRVWVADTWLPTIKIATRQHRTLVWLLDDGHVLLPLNLFDYLNDLLINHPYLKLVITLDTEHERDLEKMGALVKQTQIIRLTHLTPLEISALLHEPVNYRLSGDALEEAVRLTGGQPQWVQRLGYHIFRQQRGELVTLDDIKSLIPVLYAQSEAEIAAIWNKLSDNERLVLSAIGGLIVADPLTIIDVAAIAAWLIKTDYPLDETAVHVAIRSLEYRELLTFAGSDLSEIRLTSGLMQRRLVEDAGSYVTEKVGHVTTMPLNRRLLLLAALVIAVIALVLALNSVETPQPSPAATAPPTVTLVSQP